MPLLKNLLINTIYYTKVYNLFSLIYCGHTSILLLHRVKPHHNKKYPENTLEVTPGFLEKFIVSKKNKGWRFISIDFLLENFDLCQRRKKNIIITLDDGYKDNYDYAYPIFKKQKVPFTIYITNSFPNQKADLWWYKLGDLIRNNPVIEFEYEARSVKVSRSDLKKAFSELGEFYLSFSLAGRENLMAQLLSKYECDDIADESLMTWADIKEMSRDDLCTIGCHTMTHSNLSSLSENDAYDDIFESTKELKEKIGKPVYHFAYPYGKGTNASFREENIVRGIGFKTAVTTRIGNIFYEHNNHLMMLPRIPLYDGAESEKLNEIYLSGMYSAVTNKFKRVVTY